MKMKRIIFLLALISAFTFSLQAQQSTPSANDSIVFNKIVHDYGTIEKGSDGTSIFTFTNKGQKPLVLSNVRASCGCTVPEWPKQPVAPGETGEIKVSYNTNIAGNFNKTITVSSNAANSTVTLRVRGNVTQ
jgi:hypothetical protein